MSARGQTRGRLLRRMGWIAAGVALLALLFLISGHWILGLVFGAVAVVAIWLFLQLRTVR